MPKSYLRLRFADDHDGTGELFAAARAGGFAGEGSAYFNVDRLESFASDIIVYPPAALTHPEISSGFAADGGLEQEHLGLAVYAIDPKRGYIGVQVRMASQASSGARRESQSIARIEIVTSYEPLARFSRAFIGILRGQASEALLQGDNEQ